MKTFKQYLDEKGRCWTGYKPVPGKKPFSPGSCKEIEEDGMGGGAVSAGPTNVVGNGAIAGSGGKGGEPGVSKKRNPIMTPTFKRNPPQ
jgi:hypothetical protein